jgi:hypothetical protein
MVDIIELNMRNGAAMPGLVARRPENKVATLKDAMRGMIWIPERIGLASPTLWK